MNKQTAIIITKFSLWSLATIAALTLAHSAYAATFILSPASKPVNLGDTFSVNILMDTEGQAIDGVDIKYLNYNPYFLQLTDADATSPGTQIAAGSLMPNTLTNSADTPTGKISFSQITNNNSHYTGKGVLASLTFKALVAGAAHVDFDFALGKTTDANVASNGNDILTAVTNGAYAISYAAVIPGGTEIAQARGLQSPSFRLMKYPGNPTVYVLQNGKKSGIPSYAIYQRNYATRPIATIPLTETYPDGEILRFTSGALIKASSPAVYLVLDNGELYAFKSAEEFSRFGYKFSQVNKISNEELATYPMSGIQNLKYHAATNFVKYANSKTVYMIENRAKRGLASPDVFFAYATSWTDVLTIPADLTYPDGPVLTFPDGLLLKGSSPGVYITDQGKLRPFSSAQSFFNLGYSWGQVRTVRDSDLTREGVGEAVQ